MSDIVIRIEGLWKQYRYGTISHATLRRDFESWWARIRGKEDPNLPVDYVPSTKNQERGTKNSETSGSEADERFWALRDVSFDVKQGEVLGIIGRNGAGKSTLLKILSRVTTPTKGEIKIKGRIASLLEVGTGFHPELTGRDNIFLNGAILGMTKTEIKKKFDEIVSFAEVEKFIDTPVKRYSSGMYVRLAFAVAAHLEPEILIVDEVLAVGDAQFQKKCLGKMGEVAKEGRTVLFVSHNMAAVSQLTARCIVLNNGGIGFIGLTLEGVKYYMGSKRNFIGKGRLPVKELECSATWMDGTNLQVLEIGFAKGQAREISVGDTLSLEILIDSGNVYENLRLGYSINSETGRCLISGLSPSFSISGRGLHLAVLSINSLLLIPGNYDISISLGVGGLHNLKQEYHCILGFGSFTVKPLFQNAEPFGDWDREWAPVIHIDSGVEIS